MATTTKAETAQLSKGWHAMWDDPQMDEKYADFVDRILNKAYGPSIGGILAASAPATNNIILYYRNAEKNIEEQYELSIAITDTVRQLYRVEYRYHQRGGNMKVGVKIDNTTFTECERVLKELYNEKIRRGYET